MGWADEPYWDDPDGQFWNPGSERKVSIKCKYCGLVGLHWVKVEGKWKLYNKQDNPHFCTVVGNRNLRKELKLK